MSFFTRPLRATLAGGSFLPSRFTPFHTRSPHSTRTSLDQPEHLPTSEEPVQHYRPGGYHPTNIGDSFNNDRYTVVRKLGWGVYSTVWLAEDRLTNRHVALKVLTDEATRSNKLNELPFLQCIRDKYPQHPGYTHVIQLLDHFVHKGPHGLHLCLATEVLGPTVATLARSYNKQRMPLHVVKQVTSQVLQGLAYLHDSCNIIHTDMKTDNFLISFQDVEAVIKDELLTIPESQPLPLTQDLDALHVKISDLGVSCWADKVAEHFTDLIQTEPLRAPEVLIGAGWDKSCDIWSIGCLTYEMVMGKWLFPAELQPASHAALMILMFGNFPRDLISRSKYHDMFFKRDGSFLTDVEQKSLEFIVRIKKSGLNSVEEAEFVKFLQRMLILHPKERSRPLDLLEDTWLQSQGTN